MLETFRDTRAHLGPLTYALLQLSWPAPRLQDFLAWLLILSA